MSRLHVLTGEHSRLRRWSLFIFARYVELPLLGWSYQLLRGGQSPLGRLGQNPVVRAVLGWAVAAPFGYLGDAGRPMPAAAVVDLIRSLEGAIAVGPCRCRATHRACDHPLETDIVIRTGTEAWTRAFPQEYRPIDREEAIGIVTAARRLGLWQMVFIHCPVNQDNEYVICNCCRCGCMPYILNRDLGQRVSPLLRGEYTAVTDGARCTGHGTCVAACPFSARALVDGRAALVQACFGCGLCADICPEGAILMQCERSEHSERSERSEHSHAQLRDPTSAASSRAPSQGASAPPGES